MPRAPEPDSNFDAAILGLLGQIGVSEADARKQLANMRDKEAAIRRLRKRVRSEHQRIERNHRGGILDGFVLDADQRHLERRADLVRERKALRSALTLGERLDRALEKAVVAASVAAATLDGDSRHTHAESGPPPAIAGACYTPTEESVIDVFQRRARRLI